jgi:hypothetical protein
MLKEHIRVIIKSNQLGVPDRIYAGNKIPPTMSKQLGRATDAFTLELTLHESKTDKRDKTGIRKMMQHPHRASWSPALVLLSWLATPRQGDHVLVQAGGKPLAVATVSKGLARVAQAATGESVTARYWRPAAATWLLRCGLDVETVAALGGWKTTDSLRRYYVRATVLDTQLAAAIAGISNQFGAYAGTITDTRPSPFAARPGLKWSTLDDLERALQAAYDSVQPHQSRSTADSAAGSTPPPPLGATPTTPRPPALSPGGRPQQAPTGRPLHQSTSRAMPDEGRPATTAGLRRRYNPAFEARLARVTAAAESRPHTNHAQLHQMSVTHTSMSAAARTSAPPGHL